MIVICDTSSLIRLYKSQTLSLLIPVFGEVFLPAAVYEECQGLLKEAIDVCQFSIRQPTSVIFTQFGAGERAALNLALDTACSIVLVDDKKAINAASRVNIKTITTLQFFVLAKAKGLVVNVKPYIDGLLLQGEGLDDREIKETLRLVNE